MRNFLYNKSDILVAVIIIVVAAIIIWTRVDAIMHTDSAVVSSGTGSAIGTVDTPEGPASGGAVAFTPPETKGGEATSTGGVAVTTTPAVTTPAATDAPPAPKKVKFRISGDATSEDVARDLEADGLVKSASDFSKRLIALGKDTTIRGGTFNLKTDMTMDEIIDAITS